jgi:glycosyltransferase involved in cell wall biosynthesis
MTAGGVSDGAGVRPSGAGAAALGPKPRRTRSAPDVSVLLIVFNHERFVGQAVDGILMQRGVTFEIIVSEDRSSDRSLEIVKGKLAGFRAKRFIVSERNLGSNETILRALRAARGRYVSLLDGDDFWLVPDKLARQASLLDADPALAACFHNALIVRDDDEEPSAERWTARSQPERIALADLWGGNPFATCAGMLRRDSLGSIGDWYARIGRPTATPMVTDWPLYLASAEHGDIGFVDEAVGAYRLHDGGCYSPLSPRRKLRNTARIYRLMRAGLGRRHELVAAAGAARYFSGWAAEYCARRQRGLALLASWHALRTGGVGRAVGWRRWVRQLVRASA